MLVGLTSSMLLAYGAACSSTSNVPGPDDNPGTGTGHDASSSSPGKDGGGGGGGGDAGTTSDAASSADASTNNSDQECAAKGANDCGSCCEDHHQTGANTFYGALFGCLCGPSGKCQTQCAQTDCSNDPDAGFPQQGDPCDQCETQNAPEDGGGACGPAIDNACNGNADCQALFSCWDKCPQ
jgi:hypothetical protein